MGKGLNVLKGDCPNGQETGKWAQLHWPPDFSGRSAGEESVCNVGDPGLIPGLGRSPGEGKGYPLEYSGLENSVGCIVHGVAETWT